MAVLGYARVSTAEQNLDLQIDALTASGCDRLFTEKMSGTKQDRPQLRALLDYARPGDTVAVWRLDRLGRSTRNLIDTVLDLQRRGINFRSLTEGFDTTTAGGTFIFHIFASLAQLERDLISQRTKAGLDAARVRGRVGGRPSALHPEQIQAIHQLHATGTPVAGIARTVGTSRATVYRTLDHGPKPE